MSYGFVGKLQCLIGGAPSTYIATLSSVNAQLLFVNNFVPSGLSDTQQCIGWVWYLANDYQFSIVATVLLVLFARLDLLKSLWARSLACSAVITASIASSMIMTYLLNAPQPFLGHTIADFDDIYVKPYVRASPYFMGFLLGIWIHHIKSDQAQKAVAAGNNGGSSSKKPEQLVRLSWMTTIGTLAVCFAIMAAVLLGPRHLHVIDPATGTYGSDSRVMLMFHALNRPSWGIVICAIVFLCVTGNVPFINDLLSLKVFVPLSKLSYAVYLLHLLFVLLGLYTSRSPMHYSDFQEAMTFIMILSTTYGFAVFAALLFELPFAKIVAMVFLGRRRKTLALKRSPGLINGTGQETPLLSKA